MGITVLSLFDGISCGMVALERAGIEVDKYIAYEIEHNAIEISKKNYPEIVRGGDVTKEDFTKYFSFVSWVRRTQNIQRRWIMAVMAIL